MPSQVPYDGYLAQISSILHIGQQYKLFTKWHSVEIFDVSPQISGKVFLAV